MTHRPDDTCRTNDTQPTDISYLFSQWLADFEEKTTTLWRADKEATSAMGQSEPSRRCHWLMIYRSPFFLDPLGVILDLLGVSLDLLVVVLDLLGVILDLLGVSLDPPSDP